MKKLRMTEAVRRQMAREVVEHHKVAAGHYYIDVEESIDVYTFNPKFILMRDIGQVEDCRQGIRRCDYCRNPPIERI